MVGRDHASERAWASAWREGDACAAPPASSCSPVHPAFGKSRLANDFRAWCARQGIITATASCYATEGPLPYAVGSPLWLRSPALRPVVLLMLDRSSGGRDLARLLPELLLDDPGPAPPPTPLPEDEQRPRRPSDGSSARWMWPAPSPTRDGCCWWSTTCTSAGPGEAADCCTTCCGPGLDARLLVVATARAARVSFESTPAGELLGGRPIPGSAGP